MRPKRLVKEATEEQLQQHFAKDPYQSTPKKMNADCVSKSGSKSLRKIPLTNSWCQTIPVYQPNQAVFTFLTGSS